MGSSVWLSHEGYYSRRLSWTGAKTCISAPHPVGFCTQLKPAEGLSDTELRWGRVADPYGVAALLLYTLSETEKVWAGSICTHPCPAGCGAVLPRNAIGGFQVKAADSCCPSCQRGCAMVLEKYDNSLLPPEAQHSSNKADTPKPSLFLPPDVLLHGSYYCFSDLVQEKTSNCFLQPQQSTGQQQAQLMGNTSPAGI